MQSLTLIYKQKFNRKFSLKKIPLKVPGRLGLLITLSLIAWNVYGNTEAPPSRGFSYIEVWILGVQTIIIGAIFEYTCILAAKRSNLYKYADQQTTKLIDLVGFIFSFILFTVFNIVYWF